jgi:hypothetical protein
MENMNEAKLPDNTESIHTLNVEAIQESKKPEKKKLESNNWYDKLKYWLLIGLLAMVPMIVLGIFHKQFFLLIPLGPIVAFLSWIIRRLIKLHNLDITEKL